MADSNSPQAAQEVTPDLYRADRIGLEEVIYAAGKSARQLELILNGAVARGSRLFLTRLSRAQFRALPIGIANALNYCEVSATAWIGGTHRLRETPRIAIVTAGSSDIPVAREAERTLTYHGERCGWFADVGVAGLWRLTRNLEDIGAHDVVIVVAGMDAALPTVLGGLVGSVVIGVPTSVGYGVATGGRAALDAMLSSCAPGVAVVNIDNGYGAACAALRVAHALDAARGASGAADSAASSSAQATASNAYLL